METGQNYTSRRFSPFHTILILHKPANIYDFLVLWKGFKMISVNRF